MPFFFLAGFAGEVTERRTTLHFLFSSLLHRPFSTKREATMALRMITEKAMGLVAKQYQAALGASLAQTGEHLARGV